MLSTPANLVTHCQFFGDTSRWNTVFAGKNGFEKTLTTHAGYVPDSRAEISLISAINLRPS